MINLSDKLTSIHLLRHFRCGYGLRNFTTSVATKTIRSKSDKLHDLYRRLRGMRTPPRTGCCVSPPYLAHSTAPHESTLTEYVQKTAGL